MQTEEHSKLRKAFEWAMTNPAKIVATTATIGSTLGAVFNRTNPMEGVAIGGMISIMAIYPLPFIGGYIGHRMDKAELETGGYLRDTQPKRTL